MIIQAPFIITMDPHQRILRDGAVAIRRGCIRDIGAAHQIKANYPRDKHLHLKNSVLMPGLVNVHAHLELPPLLDKIRSPNYPMWVLNLLKQKKHLSLDDYENAARANVTALLSTGTTSVGEICTHNISPSVLRHAGIRSIIYHEIISMDPSARPPRIGKLMHRPSSLITHAVSPHSPYTVAEPVLRMISRSANRRHVPISMHVAESKDEIRFLRMKPGGIDRIYAAAGWQRSWAPVAASPIAYLFSLGVMNSHFLAVHAVNITDDDIRLLKKSRSSVAHCPRSNALLRVGTMPLKKMLDAGIPIGLGTDSLASAPSLNLWDEMRYAYRMHRTGRVTSLNIFRMATSGGAKALGLNERTGRLVSGLQADIIAVPIPHKLSGDLYSDLLRETKKSIMTMVHGKVLHMQR